MKLGIIQSRGIGDIIIAIPIADWYINRGWEVHWPIDQRFVPFFSAAKPQIHFIGVDHERPEFWHDAPAAILNELRCDRTFVLYTHLAGHNFPTPPLSLYLKFDEYKYAVAGVPFREKWTLKLERNIERETALKRSLNLREPYICVHRSGSLFDATNSLAIPKAWSDQFQIVEIGEATDNPFDWISTLEGASKLVMVNSCFSNLADQLNLTMEKHFLLQASVSMTPVLKNGWKFTTAQAAPIPVPPNQT
jgi:hypothetical protein